ncbi:hypothetical protein Tco_0704610 [Tanacetum coccineum]|uniref:Gag-Pol polyprotein n=1 Tax=Tanacetum coccineum TaxID=301880 RepID=A0ABQ4Y269_9ASTR
MSNSNTNLQTQSSNALHNAIMEAGSKDRPPMLAPGNYVQWKSRIKRYIDTKPNSELIHHCLQNPPYTYQWAEKTVPVAEGSSETTTERYMENYKNVSQDIRDQLNAEAEAVQIILTGIDNDIYSTVDACPNACEMWKAIERLKQGESINVQDLETNLYWEFGKFTSRDGESLESYYSRFYKMMNELVIELVRNHVMLLITSEWSSFLLHYNQNGKEQQRAQGMIIYAINVSSGLGKMYVLTECKQEEAGVQLNAEQADWKDDTDDESDDQELEAYYMYMAQIHRESNQLEDRVMPNNSQGKKQEVEDHRRNFKFSNNKTSVTACNDSLNAKTSNVNFEFAFREVKSYIRDLKEMIFSQVPVSADLNTITLQRLHNPIQFALMAKATSSSEHVMSSFDYLI